MKEIVRYQCEECGGEFDSASGALECERIDKEKFRKFCKMYNKVYKSMVPKKTNWAWICEFCYKTIKKGNLPKTWALVFQSAVCPSCQKKVQRDGGYYVVKCGCYANGKKDPREC